MEGKVLFIKHMGDKHDMIKLGVSLDGNKSTYVISARAYRSAGSPLTGEEICEEVLQDIAREDECGRALKKALGILAYADNNRTALKRKLQRAGFGSEAVDFAMGEILRHGYLDERRQIEAKILTLANRSLYGPHRIFSKLVHDGYGGTDIKDALARLQDAREIDFHKSLERLMEKHTCQTYEDKQKLLYRYGYKKV